MSNFSARQACDELRRFVATAEVQLNSANLQTHGAGVAEVALLLQHIKDTLLVETRPQKYFMAEFVSKGYSGIELLLRTLSVLQRLLHEASLQPPTKMSTLLNRNGSNKRKKAGIAEADCLECMRIITQKMVLNNASIYYKLSSFVPIIEHVTFLEIILISVTSPQLDSKCFALEIITNLLDLPEGFMAVFKALTSIAGKNRDDSRMTILVSQLKHGLNTSRLHIQILVVKLLNKLLNQAPALNYRILVQAESENAGFFADKLEKLSAQYGRPPDTEILARELGTWKNTYLSLVWLEKQAEAYTYGALPLDYLRQPNGVANGSIPHPKVNGIYRHDTDSFTKNQIDEDDLDSTPRSDRSGHRSYKTMRSSSTTGPLAREVLKKKHSQVNRVYDAEDGLLETNPTYFPFAHDDRTYRNEQSRHAAVRTSSMPSYENNVRRNSSSARTEGILKRTKSEQGLGFGNAHDYYGTRRSPREEQLFRSNSRRSSRPVSPVRFADEEAEKERIRRARDAVAAQQAAAAYQQREWSIPTYRQNGSTERPEPEGRSLPKIDESSRKVRRSASTASEKARMQGFSYLFPENQVVDDLTSVRRSKTPTPIEEQAMMKNPVTSRPPAYPRSTPVQYATNGTNQQPSEYKNGFSNGHATPTKGKVNYIPVRVEETGETLTRRGGGGYKPAGDRGSRQTSYSTETTSNGFGNSNGSVFRTGKSAYYGNDVDDALKRFDYLNDYSVDEGSRSSRLAN